MVCRRCGKEVDPNDRFCRSCGTPVRKEGPKSGEKQPGIKMILKVQWVVLTENIC